MVDADQIRRRIKDLRGRFRVFPTYRLKALLASGAESEETATVLKEILAERELRRATPRELEERFLAGQRNEVVAFTLNETVEVLVPPLRGRSGSVVALVGIEPEPSYIVELEDGTDVELAQSELRPAH